MRRSGEDKNYEDQANLYGRLAVIAHAHLGDEVSAEQDRQSLNIVRARLEKELAPGLWGTLRRGLRTGGLRFGIAGLAVAGAVAAVIATRPLTFTVEGGAVATTGVVKTDRAGLGTTLHFSDGTDVSLEPQAHGRVASIDRRGARIVLAEGRAQVRVTKRSKARWAFDAGPFEVQVTGTKFDLRWTPRTQRFDLWLQSGSVRIQGPMAGTGIDMKAGQRLVAFVAENSLRIRAIDDVEPRDVAARPTISSLPRPAVVEPAETPPATEAPAPRALPHAASRPAPAPSSWEQRVAAGEHETVVREAQKRGLPGVLARGSSADLAALADASRYLKKHAVARKVLLAQRQRFSTSPRAGEAAFLLGRQAEDVHRDTGEALRWYSLYLQEAPNGSYAAEALGRKMVTLHQLAGRERACPVARDYLKRQPAGPYAKIAREICPTP